MFFSLRLGRWLGNLLVVVAAIHVTACSSLPSINPMNWWASDSQQKMAELPATANTVQVRVMWQASLGSSRSSIFTPTVVGGSVYGAAADGNVTRIDAGSGRIIWRVIASKDLAGGVGADGSLVVVGTADGEVIALEADTGAVRWRARVSSEVLAAPAIAGELVLVRSADSRIFALDVRDGRRRWVFQRSASALAVRSPVGLVVSRDNAYAGFPGGKLVAIALSNGGVRWEATVAVPKGSNELDRVTDIVGLPRISEKEICAVAFQGRVACFDLSNGSPLWGREMSSVSGLGMDSGYVFVSDTRGAIHALDRTTGNSIWRQDRLYLRNLTAPLPFGRLIGVADVQGYLHLIARDTGSFEARIATDGSAISTAPILLEGGVLVQTRAGNLFALSLQ